MSKTGTLRELVEWLKPWAPSSEERIVDKVTKYGDERHNEAIKNAVRIVHETVTDDTERVETIKKLNEQMTIVGESCERSR